MASSQQGAGGGGDPTVPSGGLRGGGGRRGQQKDESPHVGEAAVPAEELELMRKFHSRLKSLASDGKLTQEEMQARASCAWSGTLSSIMDGVIVYMVLGFFIPPLQRRFPKARILQGTNVRTIRLILAMADFEYTNSKVGLNCTQKFLCTPHPTAAAMRAEYREAFPDSYILTLMERTALADKRRQTVFERMKEKVAEQRSSSSSSTSERLSRRSLLRKREAPLDQDPIEAMHPSSEDTSQQQQQQQQKDSHDGAPDAFDADEYFGRATADHHDDIAARTEYDDPDPHAPDPLAPSSHARDHVGVDDDARYDRGRDGGDDFDDEDEDEDDGGFYDRASMVPDADEDPYATPGGASGRALSSYERRRLEREQRRRRARSASSSTTPTTGGAYRRSRRGQSSYQDEEQVAEERARERRRQRGGSDGTSSRYD